MILLSVLSAILLVFVILFLVTVVKNCLRRRKYDQIKPSGSYVPGKVLAYFKGTDRDTHLTIIPKTYPAAMQTGNPLLTPAWKVIPPYTNSVASSSPTVRSSVKGMERSHSYSHHATSDPFRKQMRTPGGIPPPVVDMRRIRSPLTDMRNEDSASQKSSRSGSVGGDVVKTEDFHGKYPTDFQGKYPADDCNQVYSHSDFLMEFDQHNNDAFDDEPDAVISYDQDHYPMPKPPGPGSLFFILEYNPSVPELLVTVKSGLDLPPVNGGENSPLNSYVNFCLVPEDFLWQRTAVVVNSRNPVFSETFRIHDVLYHKLREYTLCFFVMDCTHVMGERVIGKVLYPLSDLRAEDRVEVCKELSCP